MEGPSSRILATADGPLLLAFKRDFGGDGESDPAQDIKTHFRVCRFVMETGSVKLTS